jgi:hypothetical protein
MDGLRMVKMRSYHFEILYVRKNSDNFRNPAISEEFWTALLGFLIVGRLECGVLSLAAGSSSQREPLQNPPATLVQFL